MNFKLLLIPLVPAVVYLSLCLLGYLCFLLSLWLDKTDIDNRKERFKKYFVWVAPLIPFVLAKDLLTGRYELRRNKND